jgi:hypothetical protein
VSDEDGIIFSGIIVPTSVSYRVDQAGTGFKVGQYFNIKKAGAVATTILITGITPSGGIKSFSFINYGYGFSTSFSTYLRSNKNTSESQEAFNSETNGFIESIQIYEPHDISSPARYFDSDYVTYSTPTAYYTGEQLLDQTTSSTTVSGTFTTAIDPNVAIITFFLGPLGKYPGSYASNKGFISDSQIRLEDDKLYQPFAYQTSVELEYNAFYDIVKKLVHPAGTRLFNNRLITANIDLRSSFSVETAENLFFEAHDFYSVFDNNFIETNKVISETLNLLDEESLSFTKVEADNIQTLDSDFYQLDKIVSEIITLSDFLEVDWKNKNLYNNVTVTDAVTTISISKTLSDSLILTDSGDIIFTDYAINYFSEFYGGSSSNLT